MPISISTASDFSFSVTYVKLKISRKMTTFKLNTGATIPASGFGTWQDKDDQEKAVTEALKAGVRHIDTARGMSFITCSPVHCQ
jgi:predicted aldo/keto reductase-like oxidoreductase